MIKNARKPSRPTKETEKPRKKPQVELDEEEGKLLDELENEVEEEQEEENVIADVLNDGAQTRKTGLLDRPRKKGAWFDEDDKNVTVDIAAVPRLRKLRKLEDGEAKTITGDVYQERLQDYYNGQLQSLDMMKWAFKTVDKEDVLAPKRRTHLEALLAQEAEIIERKPTSQAGADLSSGLLAIRKIARSSREDRHNAVIQSIEFHKNNQLLMTGGLDKVLKLFSLRKREEDSSFALKAVKSYYLKGLPVTKAQFIHSRNEVVACGLRKFMLSVDLTSDRIERLSSAGFTTSFERKIDGFAVSRDEEYIALWSKEQGNIEVLDAASKQMLFELKMNEGCSDAVFAPDGRSIWSVGNSGSVCIWDINTRRLANMFQDHGSYNTTSCDVSSNDVYFAAGSHSGVVNIYTRSRDGSISHYKELGNLTTSITGVRFNEANGMMLAFSKWKRNAVRLVHLPSATVFSNWPNFKTSLGLIHAASFSPDNRYLALGNEEGSLFVYNLPHYNLPLGTSTVNQ